MLEFEGRAVQEGVWDDFRTAAGAQGLAEVLERVESGWTDVSPTGGIHLHLRCAGAVPGNTKLASRPATAAELAQRPDEKTRVLIETRGEGGFMVIAPSCGRVHAAGPYVRAGGAPRTIARVSVEDLRALHALAQTFDQCERPEWTPRGPDFQTHGDRPGDDFNARADWGKDVLLPAGWTMTGRDRRGRQHWYRGPNGKRGWTSATISPDGAYLYVFSTSTDLPTAVGLSKWRAYAFLHHAGDFAAAARALSDQGYGEDEAYQGGTVRHRGKVVHEDVDQPEPEGRPAITLPNLPNDFWNSRKSLQKIRDTAHSRLVAPDALLAAVLARVAALAPHRLKIPPIVGAPGSLNFIAGLTGSPGTGKSVPQSIGSWMIPFDDGVKGPLPIGSGEGLAEAYWGSEPDPENPKKRIRKRTHYNAFVTADEGQVITALSERSGSTITATLRSVFTGGDIGQQNAADDRRRIVAAGTYSAGVAINLQPDACGPIFEGAGLGTPQRIYFASSTDPAIPDLDAAPDVSSVESLLSTFFRERLEFLRESTSPRFISCPRTVVDEVRRARLPIARGQQTDQMAAHHDLARLKIAALLALLEERLDITEEDWRLATVAKATSDAVRDAVRATLAEEAAADERRTSRRYAHREVDKLDQVEARTIRKTVECAERIRDRVRARPGITVRAVNQALWRWRDVFAGALAHAIAEAWIEEGSEPGQGGDKKTLRPRVRPMKVCNACNVARLTFGVFPHASVSPISNLLPTHPVLDPAGQACNGCTPRRCCTPHVEASNDRLQES